MWIFFPRVFLWCLFPGFFFPVVNIPVDGRRSYFRGNLALFFLFWNFQKYGKIYSGGIFWSFFIRSFCREPYMPGGGVFWRQIGPNNSDFMTKTPATLEEFEPKFQNTLEVPTMVYLTSSKQPPLANKGGKNGLMS